MYLIVVDISPFLYYNSSMKIESPLPTVIGTAAIGLVAFATIEAATALVGAATLATLVTAALPFALIGGIAGLFFWGIKTLAGYVTSPPKAA